MKQEMSGPGARRAPRFADAAVGVEQLPGGGMILRSPQPLQPYARCVGEWLERWARQAPDRTFLAERDGTGGWRKLNYGEAQAAARAIGQALLDRGLGARRPVMILSDNGIDHALLALGAMQAGVPVAPVSTAYSRLSQDFARLRYVRDLVAPGLIFADDGERYGPAIAALGLGDAELVVSSNPLRGMPATEFRALLDTRPGAAVAAAYAALGPDTVAKILFTSGSTGQPKGVVNTQRMLCSNQQSYAQAWPFLEDRPPMILDWLPWNHTFGGNSDFNLILRNGGTLFIDEGRPAPGLIERSVANLREVSPTLYLNVPRGFALILDHLERDGALARNFFRELDLIFYAGAALPQSLWQRIEALSQKTIGRTLTMVSAWGTTETAPMATIVHYPIARAGNIGLPAPVIEDAVIAGHNRDEIALLIFPSLAGCRGLCSHMPVDAPLKMLIAESAVREALSAGLARHNAQAGGSSHRIARALLLDRPASIDQGEITDKGYLNQRAVLANRAALVERLYADPPDAEVIRLR